MEKRLILQRTINVMHGQGAQKDIMDISQNEENDRSAERTKRLFGIKKCKIRHPFLYIFDWFLFCVPCIYHFSFTYSFNRKFAVCIQDFLSLFIF